MVHEARWISRLGIPAVGGQQPDKRSEELTGKTVISKDFFCFRLDWWATGL